MATWRRRTALYLAGLAVVVAVYTALYNVGMAALEGEPQSVIHSLEIVVQTLTTVGFGADAPWNHPVMTAFVVVMELTGVALIFLTLPAFVLPLLEEVLSATLPTEIDASDHVVVCGFTKRDTSLVEELAARDVEYAILVADEDTGRELQADGHTVVHGDPENTGALAGACVSAARAVVLDAGDEANAAIALTVREIDTEVTVVSYAEDPQNCEYIRYAGADRVISPRVVLGRAIADRVASTVTADLETIEVGDDFEIVELPVQPDSAVDGATLADASIRQFTGVSVIGAWFDGDFVPNPMPDRRIDRSTVLLVAGSREQLSALSELTQSEKRRTRPNQVVIVGHGEVGSTVRAELESAGIGTTVVDVVDGPNVDVVGDATEVATLDAAGVDEVEALIVAVGDDTTAIFSTLVAREFADDLQIVSRANTAENVSKLYTAGADYVLSLGTVSGRMLASAILGEDVVSFETNVQLVRTAAPELVDQTLAEADVRARTGATVVAVERDGQVVTDLPPEFRLEDGDSLLIAGTDESVRAFTEIAGVSDEPE